MSYIRYKNQGGIEYSNGELFLDFIGNIFPRNYIDYIDMDFDSIRLRVWFDDNFMLNRSINPVSRYLTGMDIGGDIVISMPATLENTGLVRESPLDNETINRLNNYLFGRS